MKPLTTPTIYVAGKPLFTKPELGSLQFDPNKTSHDPDDLTDWLRQRRGEQAAPQPPEK